MGVSAPASWWLPWPSAVVPVNRLTITSGRKSRIARTMSASAIVSPPHRASVSGLLSV
jgi:hypothetical protein